MDARKDELPSSQRCDVSETYYAAPDVACGSYDATVSLEMGCDVPAPNSRTMNEMTIAGMGRLCRETRIALWSRVIRPRAGATSPSAGGRIGVRCWWLVVHCPLAYRAFPPHLAQPRPAPLFRGKWSNQSPTSPRRDRPVGHPSSAEPTAARFSLPGRKLRRPCHCPLGQMENRGRGHRNRRGRGRQSLLGLDGLCGTRLDGWDGGDR